MGKDTLTFLRSFAVTIVLVLGFGLLPAPVLAQGQITITDSAGKPSVRRGSTLEFSGSGLPDGQISRAVFLAIAPDGSVEAEQQIAGRNRTPAESPEENIIVQNGSLSGKGTLNCLFDDPSGCAINHGEVDAVQLEIVVGGQVFRSNTLDVDYNAPRWVAAVTRSSNEIVVIFSEPVVVRSTVGGIPQSDSAADWTVRTASGTNVPVTAVQQEERDCPNLDSGCTRILRLASGGGEDVVYTVTYDPESVRGRYGDQAGNPITNIGAERTMTTTDNIRPAVPQIDRVNGVATSENGDGSPVVVVGNRNPVEVQLSNVNANHQLALFAIVGGQRVQLTIEPASPSVDLLDRTTVSATLPRPTGQSSQDRLFTLLAVATDPSGNSSEDRNQQTASEREDGDFNPTAYHLDTIVPFVLDAVIDPQDPTAVLVTLSETVSPDGNAGQWRIQGEPVSATGTGASRRLTASGPVNAAASVSWAPTDTRYRDKATNALAEFTRPLGGDLPDILPPIVQQPSGDPRYIAAEQITVAGTLQPAQDASTITEIAVEQVGGSTTDTADVAADRSWSVDMPLGADGLYRFSARARDVFGQTSGATLSGEIVHDATAPVLDLTYPPPPSSGIGGLFGGDPEEDHPQGQPLRLDYDLTEANHDRVDVVVTFADGSTETYVTTNRSTFEVPVPEDYAGDLFVEVQAHDLAGNAGNVAEGAVSVIAGTIGPERVELVANQTGDVRVQLEFGVDLAGNTVALDWAASDGIEQDDEEDTADRTPLSASRSGRVVTLVFVQPFPSSPGDRNATPRIAFQQNFGSLRGAGDEPVLLPGNTIAMERFAPADPTVSGLPSGPVSTSSDAPAGTDCTTGSESGQPVEGCPYTWTLSGSTDGSALPNTYRVFRTAPSTFAQQQDRALFEGSAGTEGTFRFTVPLQPNTTNGFRLEVVDPNGNEAAVPATFSILEDSLAPELTSLVAGYDADATEIEIVYAFDEQVVDVDLVYIDADGEERPITPSNHGPSSEDGTSGSYTWRIPDSIDLASMGGVVIRGRGTDVAGNVGSYETASLAALPRLVSAATDGLRTIVVTTSEPVTTDDVAPAGFRLVNGPGVAAVRADGSLIVLDLNDELQSGSTIVQYTGAGDWAAADGRPLRTGQVSVDLRTLFPVTGLVAGPNSEGGANLSFIDERNPAGAVSGYEIDRDGDVVTTLDRDERFFADADIVAGLHTYTVTVIGTSGLRSEPREVSVTLGAGPDGDGTDGGTSFPPGAGVDDDCPFPAAPNVTPEGGGILSCDGRFAVIVPAGVIGDDAYGRIVRRETVSVDGFQSMTSLYQVVLVADDEDYSTLDAFGGYVEASVRGVEGLLQEAIPERVVISRIRDTGEHDEHGTRVGRESSGASFITVGTFGLEQAEGATLRVFGPDPAITSDRFATAAGLSQSQFLSAGAAVLARADDYPDALAAATLAAQVGGPVLLTRTGDLPTTTLLELQRLDVEQVVLAGGPAAVSDQVASTLRALGHEVVRVDGPTRFHTAAAIATRTGSVDDHAYLATAVNFADALAASAPAAALGRPILLTHPDQLAEQALGALVELGITDVTIVGGPAAVDDTVVEALRTAGFTVDRVAGLTRYETAVALAEQLTGDDLLDMRRPLVASGDGDGVTSPDALAAGPIAARHGSPLVLTPQSVVPDVVADLLSSSADVRGLVLAGGPVAVSDDARESLDRAAPPPAD